jgi:Rrf2 family cysteine metabolism transcriptional repressor
LTTLFTWYIINPTEYLVFIGERGFNETLQARRIQDLAAHYGEGPVPNKDLSERNNIPSRFLEQILLTLKHGQIVRSQKGPRGGYYLARPPQQITLAQAVRLLDGPLAPISCVSEMAYEPCGCPDMEACGLRRVMKEVRDTVAEMMERTTLADLVAK